MRIREMFQLVGDTLESWVDPLFVCTSNVSGEEPTYLWRNARTIKSQLEFLRISPELCSKIDGIFRFNSSIELLERDRDHINSAIQEIKLSLFIMKSMYQSLCFEQNTFGFDVKLPPNTSLSELSDCAKDLNIIFSQCPLLHTEDEEIQLHGVDIGSIWLTFVIVGAGAATTSYVIKNIAAMVDKILVIREHAAVCKRQEEAARQAKLKNDLLQSVIESNKTIIKSLTQNAVEEMAQENQIQSPEEIAQIRASFDMLRKWINKGIKICAAIDAPEEIKAVFPPLETQALPDLNIKELASHKDSAGS